MVDVSADLVKSKCSKEWFDTDTEGESGNRKTIYKFFNRVVVRRGKGADNGEEEQTTDVTEDK